MSNSYLSDPLIFLVQIILGSYALLVLTRFLLQVVKADFFNPVSQFIVRLTNPVLKPVRSYVPGFRGMDISSLLVAWLLVSLEITLIVLLRGITPPVLGPFFWALPKLVDMTFLILIVSILILAVLSWIAPSGYHPAAGIFQSLASPVIRPIQRRVQPLSGIDFSPFVAVVLLMLLRMLIVPPLLALTHSPMALY